MLKLRAVDINSDELILNDFFSISINIDESVPADDLSVKLPYSEDIPELCEVILEDDDKVVFTGIVDEQYRAVSADTAYIGVVARSMAAILLDSESVPVNYFYPSASVIFSRHMAPFGIKRFKGRDAVLKEALNVPKGTTNWQVLSAFCKKALGTVPRVESDGSVNLNGVEKSGKILFSNVDGVRYNSIKENIKRCKLLSDVWVKLKDNMGYTLNVENPDAKSRGINRARYLDASASLSPIIADNMIENSNRNSYELVITSPERLLGALGFGVSINDGVLGAIGGLYVSSIYYSLSAKGEYTSLTLKKEI